MLIPRRITFVSLFNADNFSIAITSCPIRHVIYGKKIAAVFDHQQYLFFFFLQFLFLFTCVSRASPLHSRLLRVFALNGFKGASMQLLTVIECEMNFKRFTSFRVNNISLLYLLCIYTLSRIFQIFLMI